MENFIKNVEFEKIFAFAKQVEYQQGQIVSKTLAQNKALGLTLFAHKIQGVQTRSGVQSDPLLNIL